MKRYAGQGFHGRRPMITAGGKATRSNRFAIEADITACACFRCL
jgi:hypothetical protein